LTPLYSILSFIVGIVLAGLLLWYVRRSSVDREKYLLSLSLLIAALIYVAFALVAVDLHWLWIELGGVATYGVFVLLARVHSGYWLAVGWLLHPVWDIVLHLVGPGHATLLQAYAIACLSFDVLVAIYVFARVKTWNAIVTSGQARQEILRP